MVAENPSSKFRKSAREWLGTTLTAVALVIALGASWSSTSSRITALEVKLEGREARLKLLEENGPRERFLKELKDMRTELLGEIRGLRMELSTVRKG